MIYNDNEWLVNDNNGHKQIDDCIVGESWQILITKDGQIVNGY